MMSSLVVTGAIFLYGLQEAHGLEVAADGGITCPEVFQTPGLCLSGNNELQDGGKLTCTAGDIEARSAFHYCRLHNTLFQLFVCMIRWLVCSPLVRVFSGSERSA